MALLRRLLSFVLWPALVGGGMLVMQSAVGRGVAAPIALIALQTFTVLLVMLLERWMPEHRSWNVARGDVRTDALHALVSGLLIAGLVRTLVFTQTPSLGLWPARAPIAVQLLLALLIADFGSYVTHVAAHKMSSLWPIHSPHHSAQRLYWLNAWRMHPLDMSSTVLVSLLPLALLGAPPATLALFDAFAIVHITLQHSNVRLRLGLLNHVFATAEFHRWHHATARAHGESNYASFFSLWDHLLGTFRMPRALPTPEDVGLYDGQTMSPRWTDQLRHPFRVWRAAPAQARRAPASQGDRV